MKTSRKLQEQLLDHTIWLLNFNFNCALYYLEQKVNNSIIFQVSMQTNGKLNTNIYGLLKPNFVQIQSFNTRFIYLLGYYLLVNTKNML